MKKLTSKVTLLASLLAVAGMFVVPAVRAADDAAAKAEKKAKRDAENLKKYDKNKNGKLDEDEIATMKADQEKMKAEKKAKAEKK
jgi:uncharacterized protein involved in copper resistance